MLYIAVAFSLGSPFYFIMIYIWICTPSSNLERRYLLNRTSHWLVRCYTSWIIEQFIISCCVHFLQMLYMFWWWGYFSCNVKAPRTYDMGCINAGFLVLSVWALGLSPWLRFGCLRSWSYNWSFLSLRNWDRKILLKCHDLSYFLS